MGSFAQSAILPTTVETLAAWHFRLGALPRMIPPWTGIRVEHDEIPHVGGRVALRVPIGPLRWRVELTFDEARPDAQFTDRMTRGPLRSCRHLHRFTEAHDRPQPASRLEDAIEYRLPLGPLGALFEGWTHATLHRHFDWRHRRLRNDLRRHEDLAGPPLTVALSGASGLVGSALAAFLTSGGHCVRRFVRGTAARGPDEIAWDPERGTIDAAALEGVDAVVHLAGESIAQRWNDAAKRRIRDSRVRGTEVVARALAGLSRRPRVFVCASAVGYYGNRGVERVDESSAAGSGFLADVCRDWEAATAPARDAGIRTVNLRTGLVVAGAGGAVRTMMKPFLLGLGGPVGSGRQGMSWIALDDLIALVLFALRRDEIDGPVNAVAPNPLDNRAFSKALARVVRRPALLPVPSFAIRALLGEMGKELALQGAFVVPRRLVEAGFRFDFPEVDAALRFEFGRLLG